MTAPQPPTAPPAHHLRHRRARLILALLLVTTAAGVTVKYTRYYFIPRRFAVVEPGRLYRAGFCEPGPLTRIIRENQIKTILVLLNDEPDSPDQQNEAAVARREGIRMIRIGMPGHGCANFDLLDRAADIVANENTHPLLVHCYAGTCRTGAVYAAWRMKYCGWTYDQAMEESRKYALSPRGNAELFAHLKRYYAERIAPRRPQATTPS